MKILITCLLVSLTILPSALAQSQVQYSAGLGHRTVHNSNGSSLADGNQVWIGSFDAGFDVMGNNDDPAALFAAFNQFGTTPIVTLFGVQPGSFTGDSTRNDSQFNNQKIYLWIFSTDSAAAPDTVDFSNVNEYGLYSSTSAAWTFLPHNGPQPNLRQINTADSQLQALFGSFTSGQLFLSPATSVPEPSTLGLLGIAIPALVLALRRRQGH